MPPPRESAWKRFVASVARYDAVAGLDDGERFALAMRAMHPSPCHHEYGMYGEPIEMPIRPGAWQRPEPIVTPPPAPEPAGAEALYRELEGT